MIPNDIAGVKNKLYGVLSHGIHTASDEECKNLFPYMKFAIETFLDKKVGDKEKEKRIQEMNREIANATSNKRKMHPRMICLWAKFPVPMMRYDSFVHHFPWTKVRTKSRKNRPIFPFRML